MIRNVLERIGGIENYGIISILLFFACFVAALIWVFTLKKNYIVKMKNLPLEDDEGEEAQLESKTNSPSKS
jgi:cytochrome c oxidase cbb3-type subunit IV